MGAPARVIIEETLSKYEKLLMASLEDSMWTTQ